MVMDDSAILALINDAFGTCPRPEHFTNYRHCEECAEHDALLRSRDRATLCGGDLGNPGWDPLCFTSVEGFAYYFPTLARLTLEEPVENHDWLGPSLFFHLSYAEKGEQNRLIAGFNPKQRHAVLELLKHLEESRTELTDMFLCIDELLVTIALWSAAVATN